MLLLNKANLRVAEFASKEESRYTLEAIQVSEQGTCATDGHRLVRVSLPTTCKATDYPTIDNFPKNGTRQGGLMPLSLAQRLLKTIPTKETISVLNHVGVAFDELNCHTVTTDLETHSVVSQRMTVGQFPNVNAVIPVGTPTFEIAVNAALLASMAKEAAEFTKEDGYHPLRLRFYGPANTIRLDAKVTEGQQWLGVLTPITLEPSSYPKDSTVTPTASQP